jgi:hypothetical protein
MPLVLVVPAPLLNESIPPLAVELVVLPLTKITSPPPFVLAPEITLIEPPFPPVALPVVIETYPEEPLLLVPDLNPILPLTPASPDVAVDNTIALLEVDVDKPVIIAIKPPDSIADV